MHPQSATPILRNRRKRTPKPTKSKAELAQEFEASPPSALFSQIIVAAYLDCSEAKLERDRWAGGGIPYQKIGHLCRYRKADVMVFLENKGRTSTSDGAQ